MPLAKVIEHRHAGHELGDVFDALPVELRDFGDKLEELPEPVPYPGFAASAGALALSKKHKIDLADVTGTGPPASARAGANKKITAGDVRDYVASLNVIVVKSDGSTALRTPDGEVEVSQGARNLATEHDVGLSDVTGSGDGGRVRRGDVQQFLDDAAPPIDATASAIALAERHGIDLGGVQGTGKDGRIVHGDVRALTREEFSL